MASAIAIRGPGVIGGLGVGRLFVGFRPRRDFIKHSTLSVWRAPLWLRLRDFEEVQDHVC
jgi:hypothetical protein